MFKELYDLIPDKGSVRFVLTRTGEGMMSVALAPEFPPHAGDAPRLSPLSVSGPVEELETGFTEAVLGYTPSVRELASNLAQAKASAETKKPAKAKPPKEEPAPKEEPKPKAAQASFLDLGAGQPMAEGVAKRTCRVCGCTDDQACEGGCSWVEEDLCSKCVPAESESPADEPETQEEEV